MLQIPRNELKLGDVIRCFDGAYGTGTVTMVTGTEVIVTRPYLHVGDVEYTGGLLTYTGLETIRYPRDAKVYRDGKSTPIMDTVYSRMVVR